MAKFFLTSSGEADAAAGLAMMIMSLPVLILSKFSRIQAFTRRLSLFRATAFLLTLLDATTAKRLFFRALRPCFTIKMRLPAVWPSAKTSWKSFCRPKRCLRDNMPVSRPGVYGPFGAWTLKLSGRAGRPCACENRVFSDAVFFWVDRSF